MRQTAVYLKDEQQARLKELSKNLGRSEAELIREGIDLVWVRHRGPIGVCDLPVIHGSGDTADRVDELLAEGFGLD
ncbi:MAG: ribbon-helix-helix domain-containing protein [Thermocrispum sp.]